MSRYSLSIITAVWNAEPFIERCIQSVIAQQTPNVQHVIVDGKSNDGTWEIISRYAEQYPHLKVLSEKDSGQSDAMNKGVRLADAEVIGFLNADDYYEANVLGPALELFKQLPPDSFLFGNTYVRDLGGQILETHRPGAFNLTKLATYPIDDGVWPLNPSSYFFHKSLQLKVGPYDPQNHQSMDMDFILRAAYRGNFFYVDRNWGNFVKHEGSKTQQSAEADQLQQKHSATLERFLAELPLGDRLIARCFQRLRVPQRRFCKVVKSLTGVNLEPAINRLFSIGTSPTAKLLD